MTNCQYCQQPCFAPLSPDPAIRRAYQSRGVTAMATCPGGRAAEKKLLGYSYDDVLTEVQMKTKNDVLEEIIRAAPVIEGKKWAIVGIRCLWWTTFPEDVDKSGISGGRCPFCGGPVEEILLTEFVKNARHRAGHTDYRDGYGPGGLGTLIKAHHRSAQTCRVRWDRVEVKVK